VFFVVVSLGTPLPGIVEVETEGETVAVFVPETLCVVFVRGVFDEFSKLSRSISTKTNSEMISHFSDSNCNKTFFTPRKKMKNIV
jgi:hypothetical protein